MPVCLILLLVLVIFEGTFIGFNLENTCNIWLFKVYEAVPVYITVLISFAAGVLLALLALAFGRLTKRARRAPPSYAAESAASRKEKRQKERAARKERRAAAKASTYSPLVGINAVSARDADGPDSYGGGFKGDSKDDV